MAIAAGFEGIQWAEPRHSIHSNFADSIDTDSLLLSFSPSPLFPLFLLSLFLPFLRRLEQIHSYETFSLDRETFVS